MDAEDLEKDLFKNWVRGAKGLEYLQEGLQDFVGDKVELCRNQSIQKITNGWPTGSARQCNQCTSQNLLPEHANKRNTCSRSTCIEQKPNNCFGSKPKGRGKCPNGICSKLYDEIVLDHSSGDPLWKNSDPSTWCSDPLGWSFGKCFQTTISPGTSASSSDAAGLLSILINNMTIQNDWLACNDMSSKITCPFNRARDIRNAILHSSKLELDEPTLGYYLDTFITVLQDAKCLLNYNGSKQAVKKLLQLKNQQDNIRQKDVTRLMQNRKEALFELEERKAEGLREIDDRAATAISTFKKDVDNSTNVALSDIEQTKTTAKLNINEEKRSALSDIKEAKREAEQDFKDNTKAALSELEQAKKGASRGVNESAKDALSKLEDAKKEAEQGVKERTKDALSELDKAKKGAAQDVEESTKDALSELEKAGKDVAQDVMESTKTAQDVEESKNDALSELEEARQGALHDVKEITNAALSELEKAGKDVAQDVMESTKTAFSQLVEGGSEEAVKRKAANVLFLRRDREMEDESEREPSRKKLCTKKRMPNIKKELSEYLQKYYKDLAHFNKYRCQSVENNRQFSFALVPTLQIDGCEDKEEPTSHIKKTLSTECQHRPSCLKLCRSRMTYQSVLLLTNETAVPGNYLVHVWLQSITSSATKLGNKHFSTNKQTFTAKKGKCNLPRKLGYEHSRAYTQTDNHKFMSQFEGVFLLEITEEDDVSDLKKLMTKSFQMKEDYYLENILIIFECNHEDPERLRALYETVNTSNLSQCTFIIITSIDRSRVAALELNAERTLIADGIDSVIVSPIEVDTVTSYDGEKLSRQINQLIAKRKGNLLEKYPIKKVCLENLKYSVVIRLPDEIKSIHLRYCDPMIYLVHNATILDISCQNPFFYDSLNPMAIFSSTLTIVSLGFSANSHIFNGSLYKKFANGLLQNAQISTLFLRNMKVGKKVLTVKLEKQEIEQMKISMETNEDYRRYGARILGPKLEKQTFDMEDFNAEFARHDSFAAYIILDLICYELVKTHDAISECYPAKQNKTNEIYLVCFMKRVIDMDSFKGFNLVKRDDCLVSKESLKAENSLNRDEPTFMKAADKEFIAINETISYHADELMDTHRNLEAVRVSFVKSSKGQYEHPHPCIVLYCKVKGYLPFGDNCFPKQLTHPFMDKSYETDVREGFFTPCPYLTSHSTEWNRELAFGCSIGEINTSTAATLGPLVNIKETGETCFLTVRHLFTPLPPTRNDDQIVGMKVVQPADMHLPPHVGAMQDRVCGEVLTSEIGGQIDAALVKICPERLPSRGHFVSITREDLNYAGLSLTDIPTYDDGAYIDAKNLSAKDNATRRIIKIGNATSLTKGTLSTTDGVVRETMEYATLETLYNGSRETYVVKSQLLVDSYVKKIFCQAGDSGSAVFLVDDDNRLHCIGMVIGMLSNDCSAVVTPIKNILNILGHKIGKTLELKRFEFDQMDES